MWPDELVEPGLLNVERTSHAEVDSELGLREGARDEDDALVNPETNTGGRIICFETFRFEGGSNPSGRGIVVRPLLVRGRLDGLVSSYMNQIISQFPIQPGR